MSKHEPIPTVATPTVNVANILRVADAIERHEVPGLGFNMEWYYETNGSLRDWTEQGCGTTACIAGWAYTLAGYRRVKALPIFADVKPITGPARRWLGLTTGQAAQLFAPMSLSRRHADISARDAVRILRHLAATGEVNWDLPEA